MQHIQYATNWSNVISPNGTYAPPSVTIPIGLAPGNSIAFAANTDAATVNNNYAVAMQNVTNSPAIGTTFLNGDFYSMPAWNSMAVPVKMNNGQNIIFGQLPPQRIVPYQFVVPVAPNNTTAFISTSNENTATNSKNVDLGPQTPASFTSQQPQPPKKYNSLLPTLVGKVNIEDEIKDKLTKVAFSPLQQAGLNQQQDPILSGVSTTNCTPSITAPPSLTGSVGASTTISKVITPRSFDDSRNRILPFLASAVAISAIPATPLLVPQPLHCTGTPPGRTTRINNNIYTSDITSSTSSPDNTISRANTPSSFKSHKRRKSASSIKSKTVNSKKKSSRSKDESIESRRRYPCKLCSERFTTSGHLARHNRIHTGEKNHVCSFEGCNQRFSRQDNCIQHYKTHLKKKKE